MTKIANNELPASAGRVEHITWPRTRLLDLLGTDHPIIWPR
jgi:hypothetical protein